MKPVAIFEAGRDGRTAGRRVPEIQLSRIHLGRGETKTALRLRPGGGDLEPNQPLAGRFWCASSRRRAMWPARAGLGTADQERPNSPQTQGIAGNVAFSLGDRDAARRAWTLALQMRIPMSGEALNGLAMLQIDSGKNSRSALAGQTVALATQPN